MAWYGKLFLSTYVRYGTHFILAVSSGVYDLLDHDDATVLSLTPISFDLETVLEKL
jgi:hypothetical protein